jgi:hypothetical protein
VCPWINPQQSLITLWVHTTFPPAEPYATAAAGLLTVAAKARIPDLKHTV